jgi:hypothetical protein
MTSLLVTYVNTTWKYSVYDGYRSCLFHLLVPLQETAGCYITGFWNYLRNQSLHIFTSRRTQTFFATHHTSMVISNMKAKLKCFHAYWSFKADTTTTIYIYIIYKIWQSLNFHSDIDLSGRNPSPLLFLLYKYRSCPLWNFCMHRRSVNFLSHMK